MTPRSVSRALVLCALSVSPAAIAGAGVGNGSFEIPGFLPSPNYRYLVADDLALLDGWSITTDASGEASYLYHKSRYGVLDGDFALALNSGDAISQPVTLMPGVPNLVRLHLDSAAGSDLRVQCLNIDSTFETPNAGVSTGVRASGDRPWRRVDFTLTPTVADATLTISNLGTTEFGVVGLDQISVQSCLWINREPIGGVAFVGASYTLSVETGGTTPTAYQWRKNATPIDGATGAMLVLADAQQSDQADYDCVITASCGTTTTRVARVLVDTSCPADVDDGSGTGTPDDGVTVDDVLYYVEIFQLGDVAADLDDGTSTGTPDGGVTVDDLLFFLLRFQAGC